MTVLARCGPMAAAAAVLAACSPTHDWRDVRPAATPLTLLMPCRPVAQQRALALAGATVQLSLSACTAGGQTWALAHADVADPARVAPALAELRNGAAGKLGSAGAAALPLAVAGATPNPHAGRWRLQGGAAASGAEAGPPLLMELAVFARGTQVFQASVLGAQLPGEATDTFFASLRFVP